ncbi:DUF6483 family protein [Paenibacillus thalictri]|uniref:Uncharacterized protein n=1 Tax=Paenibacillus thalictri TaxID=2527873 RepID=A0A4V2J460_9BACL|nr:DUF6483 family protein [Paenibacillus thalictri]TBL77879.1 hypothetical protein EYB31_17245 [Paenibacillus thalictri]
MYQRDYILRMIEQITYVVATKVFQLKQMKKYEDALAAMGELFTRLSLPSSNAIRNMSARQIADMMSVSGILPVEKVKAAAELIEEEGSIRELMEEPETAAAAYAKALQLHLLAYAEDDEDKGAERIDRLLDKLTYRNLPYESGLPIVRYYERTGQFSRAEDVLFLTWNEYPSEELLAGGLNMYERLLLKPDSELEAGGLPRGEVLDGRTQLQQLANEWDQAK